MIDWTCLSVNNKKERRSYRVKKQPKYSLLRTRKSREREKTEGGKKKGVSNNSLGIDGRFFQLIIRYRKEDAMIQNFKIMKVFQNISDKLIFINLKIENYYRFYKIINSMKKFPHDKKIFF
jgi:hypothetical protein